MNTLEVMRRVLTAYETHDLLGMEEHMQDLRLAIEQAERQEPVAWMWKDGTLTIDPDRADGTWTPLYTTPPLTEEEQCKNYWQNLTDAEHMQLAEEWGCMSADWVFYAAAIERKIKEKQSAWLESLIKESQIASHAKRLALELESLLLATHDTEAVSTWWQSAYQAMHNYQDDVDRLYPQDHVSPLGKD